MSQACARMCKVLTGMPVLAGESEGQELVNVRTYLVNRCQAEFAKHKALTLSRDVMLEEVGRVQDSVSFRFQQHRFNVIVIALIPTNYNWLKLYALLISVLLKFP